MSLSPFNTYADYVIPLLRVMATVPNGRASSRDALALFWDRYQERIPTAHFVSIDRWNQLKWESMVKWARRTLKERGLMDAPSHGVWGITSAGREWLASHEDATHLDARPPNASRTVAENRASPLKDASSPVQIQAPERSVYFSAHAIADAQIDAIWNFLHGSAARPSDERLCDWVHFCYEFQLYHEGRDIFALVNSERVNSWYYDRARRLAKVCTMKASGQA